jgi:hypothetical protein
MLSEEQPNAAELNFDNHLMYEIQWDFGPILEIRPPT